VNYIKENYHAHRMVLAGAGAVKHEQLVDLANKHFSGLPTKKIDPRDLRTTKKVRFVLNFFSCTDTRRNDDSKYIEHSSTEFYEEYFF
jgi:hypothetical protein